MNTDPNPEAIITPYEPADPLPGVAPELRHDAGGYWRGDTGLRSYDRTGEPDWRQNFADAHDDLCAAKDELPDRPEGEPLVDGVRRVVEECARLRGIIAGNFRCAYCEQDFPRGAEAGRAAALEHVKTCEAGPYVSLVRERDALRGEVEKQTRSASFLAGRLAAVDRERLEYRDVVEMIARGRTNGMGAAWLCDAALTRGAKIARETAGNAPLARNDAPDGSTEGVEAQEGVRAADPYAGVTAEDFAEMSAGMVRPSLLDCGACGKQHLSPICDSVLGVNIEAAAEAVHDAYLTTCARLGWDVKRENAVPYAELSEESKELDRASVRTVLALVVKGGAR